jgi:glycosyltransferase involved in cell wall biosynthesis
LFLVLQESSIDIWKRKLDWIAERGGMALLNVHPDYMNFDGCRGVLEYSSRLYEEFLDYVVQRYGNRYWAALPRDVATYVSRHRALASNRPSFTVPTHGRLQGKRVAMVTFSRFPEDPRPRRAAETLVQEGMTVDMICLRGDDKPPRREVLNGIDVLRIPIKHRRETWVRYAYEYSAFILIAFLTLALRSLTRGYDLIYIHNMPDILIFSSLVPKVSGAKVLLDLHDPMPELMETISKLRHDSLTVRFLKRLEKWSIGYADLVVTVNLACKRIFSSRSCRPGKIGVVMNAPDEEIFALRKTCPEGSATRVPTEPFVIMYHGTLVERNGLDLAFEALTKVRNAIPSVELRVYGVKTPYLERLLDSAGTNSVHTAIRYLGPRRLEDLVHEIEECHVGIIPNHRNCFTQINTPVRIFEYLALGKPVIAPSAPGIQDYFERESLIFFELGNAEDLARQIEYVYAHPAETVEIVKRGQQVYRAHAWRNQRQTLVDLIGELL